MQFEKTAIEGVWIIRPQRHGDRRGYFSETFRADLFGAHIGDVTFVQDNESMSARNVVRGMHLQREPYAQAKLVRVSEGRVMDVAVDMRRGSDTFGRHISVILDADEGTQLFIPRGFAHGFRVLSEYARFQYKVDNIYAPQAELSVLLDDPDLGIDWGIAREQMVLSDRDMQGITWRQAVSLLAQD